MTFGTEGVYGIPTYVSSSYIFLFILFGAFLEKAGMITLFTDIALGLFGSRRGGPAKVAVVASGLMGTISGSGVANVVTTGQFTIPLMMRFGYKPAFAGGVEATASMGGQIMPPVMGAVAFIMAETLDVPYATVVKAAVVPAILYFLSAFWMVHLEAGRAGLAGLAEADLPSPMRALKQRWYLILPLAVLVALLFSGYTPLFAGTVGLALTVMLILGGSIALGLPSMTLRVILWIGIGLVAASFQQFGMVALTSGIVVLIAVNAFRKGGRETLALCRDSLAEGAKTALPVGIACAIVGIIIGTMTLTGAANTFGQFVVAVGKESLFLSLLLTMVTCLILGMGIPTIPNYIITCVDRRSGAARSRRAAAGQPHVRVLFRHPCRPDATGRTGLFCRSADRQGARAGDLDPGDQGRRGGFRDSVHGGLFAGADVAARRADGSRMGSGRRRAVHHRQGDTGNRSVGSCGHRLHDPADERDRARAGGRCCDYLDRRAAADRRGRICRCRLPRSSGTGGAAGRCRRWPSSAEQQQHSRQPASRSTRHDWQVKRWQSALHQPLPR